MDVDAIAADLELVGDWLARRDVAAPVPHHDVVVLCGSSVLDAVLVAADALHAGAARRILVTGGTGHSTPYLRSALAAHTAWGAVDTGDRTEADLLAEVLVRFLDLPAAAVATETASTHCGDNARLSLRLLEEGDRVLLVQDPTMQRRTHAGFDHWSEREGPAVSVTSLAPFVPVVSADGVGAPGGAPAWSHARFASLVLGEVRRLRDDEHGYGPRGAGFLPHVDVPEPVGRAAARIEAVVPDSWRGRTAT